MPADAMSHAEHITAIAAKFYEARRLLKVILTDYEKTVGEWRRAVQAVARDGYDGDVMAASREMLRQMNGDGDGMAMMAVLAATVDLIEGANRPGHLPRAGAEGDPRH